jgi:hypothetical protein
MFDEQLKQLAFLYTCSFKGGASGIRFMLSIEDAKKLCSDPRSKGVSHGSCWAYFFTTVYSYVHKDDTYADMVNPLARSTGNRIEIVAKGADDGSFDEILKDLGCEKIAIKDIPEALRWLGVDVTIK